ncbi:MAG: ThuA domain-containing protein [Armatimonadota bacterium]|nr:ThuA domain-containing protein [Armatimonadota bacterium]
MKKAFILTLTLMAAASLLTACYAAPAKKPIKVLFEIEGCCHDFKNLPPMLADKLKATGDFEFTITADRDELVPARIAKYDVALFYTQGSDMTPEQEKGLTEFVKGGKGYVGIHCASDTFKNSDAYWNLVGGRFKSHGHGTFPVHFTVRRHELTQGLADFDITDETYVHDFHKDAKIVVLARRATDSEPAVWIRQYGAGRVFFTGLGHGKEAWNNESFQTLMTRALYWAACRGASCNSAKSGACCAK